MRVCADGCTEYRTVGGRSSARFSLHAGRVTRAVVTAKKGDRVVAQHPLDFEPGDFYRVELAVQ